jgi:gamma-glutamylputrescine oxidase
VWQDEPYVARPPLDGDRSTEVCVVGGGIGGVATAFRLARRGTRVLLVEARTVASGASGRNGGFFIAGAAPMYHESRALWGREHALRVYRATLAAQREVLELADALGAREHLRVVGMLRLAVDEAEAQDVRAHHAALREDGLPGELVAGDDLPGAVRRPGRVALLTPHDGAAHPVRWVRALARAAESEGAEIVEGTSVIEPPRLDGGGVMVRCDRGEVRADRVVVAIDAGLGRLVPAAGAVRSRRLNMLATAPAPAVLPCPVYARHGLEYAQQLPGGRLALGGFSDLDGEASWTEAEELSVPVQERLDRYLREELGVDAPVTHRWVGLVGYADDPLPTCGPAPGSDGRVLALGGYHGTGFVQGFLGARIVAELLADGASADADLYRPPQPGPPGARPRDVVVTAGSRSARPAS